MKPVFAETGGEYGDLRDMSYRSKQMLLKLWTVLETERSSWDTHWQDLADFILPRRVRFQKTERNKGDKRNQKIINNSATLAARTLRSGMQAGLTSPARPWFKLSTYDPMLTERDAVKLWLHDVTRLMNTIMHRSNLYNALPIGYGDMGVFGTTAISVLEDDEKVLRAMVPPLGSYVMSTNDRGIVDCFGRECEMTVRQVIERFVQRRPKSGSLDFSNVSNHVKNAYMRDDFESTVNVKHFILPNADWDPEALEPKFKRYKSCYFEESQLPNNFLRESGYDDFPILCPRWDVSGNDIYGTSPGMDALGDVKSLQVLERRKAQAVEKLVNPPMTGPSSLRSQKFSLLPGDITYEDVREGQKGLRPAHEINFPIKEVMVDIEAHQYRISRAFYEDLFLMLSLSDRREMTATEVAERHEEKLLVLGPVLERLNDELLDPLIDRVFKLMLDRDMLPPPPKELEEENLKVEYLSIWHQAQKMVNVGSVERFTNFVVAQAEVNSVILDKVDSDQLIDEYGDMLSIAPRIIRSDDAVAAIREQRAAAQRAQVQAENMERMAKAVKSAATAPMGQDSALTRLVEGAGV